MSENLSIIVAQTNPKVGDIQANKNLILEAISEYRDYDLIVFSELMLTGYPPEDLVLKSAFQKEVNRAANEIAISTKSKNCEVLFGMPWLENEQLFNAAVIVANGEIKFKHFKNALPNYGVFDEKRVFYPGSNFNTYRLKDKSIGVFICEDVWVKETHNRLPKNKIDIAISLNASPYEIDKPKQRIQLVSSFSKMIKAPVIYVNQVGGQDELVFDGNSFVIDQEKVLYQAKHFTEEYKKLEVTASNDIITDYILHETDASDEVYSALILGLRDYIAKNKFPGVVVGISGGIDSAFSICVAVDALGPEKVKGILMPSKFTSDDSNNDATELGKKLNIQTNSIAIEDIVSSYESTLSSLFENREKDITEENIQSRARGMILMAYSNKFGHMVVTNGNKSEVSVGYSTLYGDMCGGYSVVKDLYKSDLYRLAEWRNKNIPSISMYKEIDLIPKNIISKEPTAELKPNQMDKDTLPPYDILDKILYLLVEKESSVTEVVGAGYDEDTVIRVQNMLYNSEYKRRQAAPGVKISERNFGYDRRYPITNGFRDAKED
ncbi:MAG: NAD+ synthase [Pelagibacteraceae bacterium]|nr:NAD+ synthase [Pelagibacteraceae bacterium]|tara:strand:+ start:1295 stop:2944 length:1650 start_codon:yes stop_codon:yes gene_type:complete